MSFFWFWKLTRNWLISTLVQSLTQNRFFSKHTHCAGLAAGKSTFSIIWLWWLYTSPSSSIPWKTTWKRYCMKLSPHHRNWDKKSWAIWQNFNSWMKKTIVMYLYKKPLDTWQFYHSIIEVFANLLTFFCLSFSQKITNQLSC